jgi:cysteine desulfurase
MNMETVYLDYAATTPVHPEVLKAMLPYFTERFGNPSSIYSLGHEAKDALEEARVRIARFIGAHPGEVYFVSDGTEANNFIIKGIAFANENRGNHIITTSIEHHSVIDPCAFLEKKGFRVTYLPVYQDGMVDPDIVKGAITDKTILISVMHANNEVGTIEPIAEIGRIARERGIYFHTDAVQTVGHLPLDVNNLHIDALSASAHKLHGPKGIGIAYVKRGVRLIPSMYGGEQEGNYRAGTENLPGIVGFSKAAEIAEKEMKKETERLILLRDRFIKGLFASIEHIRLNGHPVRRLPNNVNISIDGIDGDAMLLDLRLESICASNGAACHSSRTEPSHVLLSMGLSDEAAGYALRFTLGRYTTEHDISRVLEVLARAVERLKKFRPTPKR